MFVGLAGGSSKMSSSTGGAAIPATALDVLEPAMLRWLYVRRAPSQSFTIDLSPRAVQRLYDEWDQFGERAEAPEASPAEVHLREVCLRTSAGAVDHSRRRVPFRLLSSAADITQANTEQIDRLVRQHLDGMPDHDTLVKELEPRLSCAIRYATLLLPPEERTTIRTEFNSEAWQSLDERIRDGVRMLDERIDDAWTLEGLTTLVYGVPKLLRGLPLDTLPTPELKKAQRAFFTALYHLLCSSDTGPRLPTLLLSIGPERAHWLLTGPGEQAGLTPVTRGLVIAGVVAAAPAILGIWLISSRLRRVGGLLESAGPWHAAKPIRSGIGAALWRVLPADHSACVRTHVRHVAIPRSRFVDALHPLPEDARTTEERAANRARLMGLLGMD